MEGNVCNFDSVRNASAGIDAVIYMTMGRYLPIGEPYHEHVDSLTSSLNANVKGIYLSLYAAQSAGVQHAVYTSSMSVYDEKNLFQRYFADEEIQPTPPISTAFASRWASWSAATSRRKRQ